LRHADRAPFATDLNEKGIARAEALPAAVADLDIDVIYSPDKKRNLDTVKPLIAQRGIKLRVIEISNVAERLIMENPGKTVMWVGNTDTLQSIYGQLGGKDRQPDKYGEIAIMQIYEDGPPKIMNRTFGPMP
jgi:broad specificity phosphatase PhoE